MASTSFDFFVIGAGSGGVRAARMAAQRGVRVAVAEAGALGGTCVNLGCIPKKLYSNAAHYAEAFEEARGYGWQVAQPTLDWAQLKANRAREISRLNGIYERLLLEAGVTVLRGHARLAGPHHVELNGQRFEARHVLVATGGRPLVPELPGGELAVSSNEMFDLPVFPQHLVVVGGGYIACEMASIFHGLGAQVTQMVRGTQLLRGFDADVSSFVADEMTKKGVVIRLQSKIESMQPAAGGVEVRLQSGQTLEADSVLNATGRIPNTAGLGLQEAGVNVGPRGEVRVDANYQTNLPSVHAVGDVTDKIQLTPVALAEAMVLVDRLFGDAKRCIDYEFIPTAVFTHPNIGTVGLTEAQAREKFAAVRIYRTDFKALRHTLSGSSERTMMKLVVDDASDRVVGAHMVGADAGEIVQGLAVALRAGATKAVFDSTIGIHPTVAEEFVTLREPLRR